MPNILKTMYPNAGSVIRWIALIVFSLTVLVCCVSLVNYFKENNKVVAENASNKKTAEVVGAQNKSNDEVAGKKEKADEITNSSTTEIDKKKDDIKTTTDKTLEKKKQKVDQVKADKPVDKPFTPEQIKEISTANIDAMWTVYCQTECTNPDKV